MTHRLAAISRRVRAAIRRRQPGLSLAVLSVWLGLVWAAAMSPLSAPDEPAYLQTVMQVRDEYILPEIHFDFTTNPQGQMIGLPGSQVVREYTDQAGMGDPIRMMAYQSVQPPLYFLITASLAQLVPGTPPAVLYLSRLVSVVFGAGIVYFCWAATRQLAPAAPMWAVAAAGAIALLPEFCFNNARAGNDSLVNCMGAAVFYGAFRGLRQPQYDRWMIRAGGLFGLALLSKLTAFVLAPGLALVVLFRAWQVPPGQGRWQARLRRAVQMALGCGVSTALVAGWWFLRNMIAYGEPTGTREANVFWHLNLPVFSWENLAARADFIQTSWRSFWGLFGWMTVSMPDDFYAQALTLSVILAGLSVLAALGLGVRALLRRQVPVASLQAGLVMAVVVATLLYSFVQFSVTVALQAQGRYLYLLLLPAALVFTGGLYALVPGRRLKAVALSVPLIWMAAMNAVGIILVR